MASYHRPQQDYPDSQERAWLTPRTWPMVDSHTGGLQHQVQSLGFMNVFLCFEHIITSTYGHMYLMYYKYALHFSLFSSLQIVFVEVTMAMSLV